MAGDKRSHQQAGLADTTAPSTDHTATVDLTMDDGGDAQPAGTSGANQQADARSARESSAASSGEPAKKKQRKKPTRWEDLTDDWAAHVRRRYRALQRTGQSCDGCMARRLTCDNNPGSCAKCTSYGCACTYTDRNTMRTVYRGYWGRIETAVNDLYAYAYNQRVYLENLHSYSNLQSQYITSLENALARYTNETVPPVGIPDDVRESLDELAAIWPLAPVPALPLRFAQPSRQEEENRDRLAALGSRNDDDAAPAATNQSNGQASTSNPQTFSHVLVPPPAQDSTATTNSSGSTAQRARSTVRQRGALRGSRGSRAIGATGRVTRSTTQASRNAAGASTNTQQPLAGYVPAQQPQNGQQNSGFTAVNHPAQGSSTGTRDSTCQFGNTQTVVPQQLPSYTNSAQGVDPSIFSNDQSNALDYVDQFVNAVPGFPHDLNFDAVMNSPPNQRTQPLTGAYSTTFAQLTASVPAPPATTTNVAPQGPLVGSIDPTLMQGNAPGGTDSDGLLGLSIAPTNGSLIPDSQIPTGAADPAALQFDPLFDDIPDSDPFEFVTYDNEEEEL